QLGVVASHMGEERAIVGVYIGWRGQTVAFPKGLDPGKPLTWWRAPKLLPYGITFWDRKNTAARVAGVSCTEAILSLTAVAKMRYLTDAELMAFPQKPTNLVHTVDKSKVIIIGHSFGGLIVERAVTQALLGGWLMSASREQGNIEEKARLGKDL